MSGGWRRTFNLNSAGTVTLTFRYNLTAGGDYESDELSRVLASVDGALLGNSGYIAQVVGNGEGGAAVTTGWQQYTVSIPLAAGSHTLVIGGFNNRKTTQSESSTITIDDVGVTLQP
jgi:hypothetical protein